SKRQSRTKNSHRAHTPSSALPPPADTSAGSSGAEADGSPNRYGLHLPCTVLR
ncbi:hypothetical protein LTR28_010080, partial [Elasticomyces elasticus]